MENITNNLNLFSEFEPVSTRQWKEKIIKDLKGKPYEKLIRKTTEGFEVKPFYREEDLEKIAFADSLPGNFPFVRGKKIKDNRWLVREDIVVDDTVKANGKVKKCTHNGVDSVGFIFPEGVTPDYNDFEKLLDGVNTGKLEINLSGDKPVELLKLLMEYSSRHNDDSKNVTGSINCDPVTYFSRYGHFRKSDDEDFSQLVELFKLGSDLSNFQLITVNAHLIHNAGGGVVSEMAYALAMGVEYLTFLTGNGFDIDEVALKIRFHFSVGSEYFMEIAKFRAFRLLWAQVVSAYGAKNKKSSIAYIHASGSLWNKTIYDPYVNMLRTTTETMSAIIGGIDSLVVLPFDTVFDKSDDFSERIARNQQLILKEESYFDKVADPAGGSYYIENLTNELINSAWSLFLEIDKNGGYLSCFQKGIVQERIKREATVKNKNIETGKQSVLGVNQYPNITEHIEKLHDETKLFPPERAENHDVEPLIPYRGSMVFEQLRYRTDRYALTHPRPKVWMFPFGNLAIRSARSQFAGNFFGVAGFEIINNQGFDTVSDGVAAAIEAKPDIVVLCASDDDYEVMAIEAFMALKDNFIVVLAGYPANIIDKLKAAGIENFIHLKSNLLKELKQYQEMLGIAKLD